MSDLRLEALLGQVLGGGAPVERATVTLWAATAGAPVKLGQAATGADGRFRIDPSAASPKARACTWSQRVASPPLTKRAATTTG
jgi:hypothetical protein